MINIIQQIDSYESLTPEQIEEALAAQVLKPESYRTFNQLVRELGDVVLVETMIGAMRAAGLNASADSVIARGIEFGLGQTQQMIDFLGAQLSETFTPEIVAQLKAIGLQSRWQSLGGEGEPPNAEAIADEFDRYAGEQLLNEIKSLCDAAYEAAAVQYRAGNFNSIVSAAQAEWSGE